MLFVGFLIKIFVQRNSRKWTNEIRSFRSKFSRISMHFRPQFCSIFVRSKLKYFHFASKNCIFAKKIRVWRKGRKFRTNFAKIFAKINATFRFVFIFVGWTKFSRKRLNENLEMLVVWKLSEMSLWTLHNFCFSC